MCSFLANLYFDYQLTKRTIIFCSNMRVQSLHYHTIKSVVVSVVSLLFLTNSGKILNKACLYCYLSLPCQVSVTLENFQDISLPIPGKEDLAKLHSSSHQTALVKAGSCGEAYAPQGWISFVMEYIKRYCACCLSIQNSIWTFVNSTWSTLQTKNVCLKNSYQKGCMFLLFLQLVLGACGHTAGLSGCLFCKR